MPRNPSICRFCGDWLRKKGPGGAHIELTLLFADIRGSTRLAERLTAESYVDLINRFYASAAESFGQHGAIIEKLVGDEAIGLFVPAFVRGNHAAVAYETAVYLLRATGRGSVDGPGGGAVEGVQFFEGEELTNADAPVVLPPPNRPPVP